MISKLEFYLSNILDKNNDIYETKEEEGKRNLNRSKDTFLSKENLVILSRTSPFNKLKNKAFG